VQIGTANFINPTAPIDILNGIRNYMVENNITNIEEIVGKLNT